MYSQFTKFSMQDFQIVLSIFLLSHGESKNHAKNPKYSPSTKMVFCGIIVHNSRGSKAILFGYIARFLYLFTKNAEIITIQEGVSHEKNSA